MSDDPKPQQRRSSFAEEVGGRVRSILEAAEAEAAVLLEEARSDAEARLRQARVDADARLRVADSEAERRLDAARRQADELVRERERRLAELTDGLVARAELVLSRMEDADRIRRQVDALVRALGEVAERVAREAGAPIDEGERSAGAEQAAGAGRPAVQPTVQASVPPPPAPERGGGNGPPAKSESRPAPAAAPAPAPAPSGEAQPSGERPPDRRVEAARLVAAEMAASGRGREEIEAELRDALGIEDPAPIVDELLGGGRSGSVTGFARRVFR